MMYCDAGYLEGIFIPPWAILVVDVGRPVSDLTICIYILQVCLPFSSCMHGVYGNLIFFPVRMI